MCPYIQSTGEEKGKAQTDTDAAVSFGHRAEFSTPKTGSQSEIRDWGQGGFVEFIAFIGFIEFIETGD